MLFYIKGTIAECQKFLDNIVKDTTPFCINISTHNFDVLTRKVIPENVRSKAITLDIQYKFGTDHYVIKTNSVFNDNSIVAIVLDYHSFAGYLLPKIGIVPVIPSKVPSGIIQLNFDMNLKDIITLSEFV